MQEKGPLPHVHRLIPVFVAHNLNIHYRINWWKAKALTNLNIPTSFFTYGIKALFLCNTSYHMHYLFVIW